MAIAEMSRVTQAITTFFRQAILARGNVTGTLTATAAPPQDDTIADQNILSVYLFHVIEDPYAKNLTPQQVQGDRPIAIAPLALVCNYVVTARVPAAANAGDRALREQLLIGEAAAVVHQHPELSDATRFPPDAPVFQTAGIAGDDNRIQLAMRPVGIDEAINFWSAEQDLTARLSLFFEARLILLAPPPATVVPGIVLSVGSFVFASSGPVLRESRSTVAFPLPPGFGTGAPFQSLAASPARPSLFGPGALPPTVPPNNNRLVLAGDNLTGERVFLRLTGPMRIDGGAIGEATVRLSLDRGVADPAWQVVNNGSEVRITLQGTTTDVAGRAIVLLPGLFQAAVVTANQRSLAPGAGFMEDVSVPVVVAVSPQVVAVTPGGGPPAARAFALSLHGSYLDNALEVSLAVGGVVFSRAPAPGAGEFDFAPGTGTIAFVVDTTGLASPLPVRLTINGADATPAWAVFP